MKWNTRRPVPRSSIFTVTMQRTFTLSASGRPPGITGEERAKITALACSEPPQGYGRWSLRLLADKIVAMGVCEHIIPYEGGRHPEKIALKPHLNRSWCIAKINSRFLARMEHILALYAREYTPSEPVVCFDERPCFLIGDTVDPIAMQSASESIGSFPSNQPEGS